MPIPGKLVVDTSVWINLLATQHTWRIVEALGRVFLTPEQVVREVRRDPVTGAEYDFDLHPLRRAEGVVVVQLNETELEVLVHHVSGAATDALGDGEAAVLAVAHCRNCGVALDENKARRIIREQYPAMPVTTSYDIFTCSEVRKELGEIACKQALEDAQRFARMHIPKA